MKDKKSETKISREPSIGAFSYDEFFNNRLSLPQALKDKLNGEGLDWRFINTVTFRESGNMHRSHWMPYKLTNPEAVGITTLTPEGHIRRGDLVLATRPKQITAQHKKFLAQRNAAYSGQQHNKTMAQELKRMARDYNVDNAVKVHEGYDEND